MAGHYRRLAAAASVAGALAGFGVAGDAVAQTASFDEAERAEIEGIVREYILENPDIIMEAIAVLRAREEMAAADQQRSQLVERRGDLVDSATSPSIGAVDSDIVLVEFFDYNCGYCKRVVDNIFELAEANPDLRVVFKEFPILSQSSETAARAALAAANQDLYVPMHNALMEHRGGLNDETIFAIAEQVGLDVERLREDMSSEAVSQEIAANADLAIALGIRGTPAFVIGDTVIPGAVDLQTLQDLVEQQREQG